MMPSIPGQKPTASGSFADRPFAHILVYLHQKKLHGSLVVREGQRSAEIYFDGGLPTKVRSSTRGRELGLILTEMGAITEAQYQACLQEMARHGGLQGKVLLAQRAVTVPVLSRALREQIMLKLVDVFSMVQGNYLFYEGLNLLEGFGSDEPLTVDLEAVLMAGVRLHGDRLDLEPVLHGLQSRWLSVADSEAWMKASGLPGVRPRPSVDRPKEPWTACTGAPCSSRMTARPCGMEPTAARTSAA